MKFDDVFPYLGDFGPYQRQQYFMLGMVLFSCGAHVMMTVFTLAVPAHRCAIPGLANDTYEVKGDLHASLINSYVPRESSGPDPPHYSQCRVYNAAHDNASDGLHPTNVNLSEAVGFSRNVYTNISGKDIGSVPCSSWVYSRADFTSTIATQMNFVCEQGIQKSHTSMTLMSGQVIGCLLLGPMADVIGRKKMMMICLAIHLLASVLITWAVNVYMLGTLFLLNGMAMATAYCTAFTLDMELIGPKWRHVTGVASTIFWSFGMLWVCFLAYFLRDWQHLQLAASCPIVLFSAFFVVVPESARWLIGRGRHAEARAIVLRAARTNGRSLPAAVLTDSEVDEKAQQSDSIMALLKCPPLLIRALITFLNWAVCSLTYYGLSLNVGQLSGDIYLNFCLMAVFEIVASLIIMAAMGRFGRKVLYCSLLNLGAVSCILTLFPVLFGDKSVAWTVSMLAMIGKFGVSGAFSIVWMFTSELFPTSLRASVTSTSSGCARLGAVAASYIANLNVDGDIGVVLPQIIFGACGIVAGVLALFLPETQKKQLPESIQDAMKFLSMEVTVEAGNGVEMKPITDEDADRRRCSDSDDRR
ncbi:unnamed protein product [Lymnaea stagnalis]|uniref:Major facilitator superfamily (MFS) profile domain-containing protein n=1 Tax=Lymnaea stagnalis TaxID=6523 RepID=A0AAV2HCX6_LYMST